MKNVMLKNAHETKVIVCFQINDIVIKDVHGIGLVMELVKKFVNKVLIAKMMMETVTFQLNVQQVVFIVKSVMEYVNRLVM